jgi:hypothetical protein
MLSIVMMILLFAMPFSYFIFFFFLCACSSLQFFPCLFFQTQLQTVAIHALQARQFLFDGDHTSCWERCELLSSTIKDVLSSQHTIDNSAAMLLLVALKLVRNPGLVVALVQDVALIYKPLHLF